MAVPRSFLYVCDFKKTVIYCSVYRPIVMYLVDSALKRSNYIVSCQIIIFQNRLNGQPIGVSVLGIFVVDKNTILAVRIRLYRK